MDIFTFEYGICILISVTIMFLIAVMPEFMDVIFTIFMVITAIFILSTLLYIFYIYFIVS